MRFSPHRVTFVTWAGIAAVLAIVAARPEFIAPMPPMLLAERQSDTAALLVWRYEPGYRFARIELSTRDAHEAYHVLARIDGHSNTMLKPDLHPNVPYRFRARACLGTICSRYSDEVVVLLR
jgi:hypothetical protein